MRSNLIFKEQTLHYSKVQSTQRFPSENAVYFALVGGAREDRTPDLLRARQALSQLSYGPGLFQGRTRVRPLKWWVWEDLNLRPHPYQGCALTS